MKTLLTAAAALSLITLAAEPAAAQSRRPATQPARSAAAPATPAAAPAAAPLNWGPPITGICVFSFDRAVGRSSAGAAAATRMQQLTAQVQAELQPEQTSLQTDANAFKSQQATLPQDQVQARGQALQARVNAYEQKAQLRQQELRATGAKAQQRIGQEIEPILRQVTQARSCSILLGEGVLGVSPQMDLTDGVVSQLNVKLPTLTFDREHLDQQAAPASR